MNAKGNGEDEDEEDINSHSGEEPLSFSGHVSNSLLSLASLFLAIIHLHSIIQPERAAFHPQAHLPSPSCMPL